MYLTPPLKGFPLEFGISVRGQKTRMMGLPDRERSLTISLAILIQYANVTEGQTERQTDRHRPTAITALIRIASRGKRVTFLCKRSSRHAKVKRTQLIQHLSSVNGLQLE